MTNPKFQVGDPVKVVFYGDVEGVPVQVTKTLWVYGVVVERVCRDYGGPVSIKNKYCISDNFPSEKQNHGKTYEKMEETLIEIEPVQRAILIEQRNNKK